jgi:hypothetical protein
MASVTFTSPTSSTVWQKTLTVNISWARTPTNTGTWGVSVLYLYKGASYDSTIASSLPASQSSYNWTIPEGLDSASDYTIQIHTSHDAGE